MSITIEYYSTNTDNFIENTINVDMKTIQENFIDLLQPLDLILDFGCGSGRDTKYFLTKGFHVEAIDGCKELCKKASNFTGLNVKHLNFYDFHEINKYNGIWACASLLHIPKKDIPIILRNIEISLKINGIFYCSFKKGNFEGIRNKRYFSDFENEELISLIQNTTNLRLIKIWNTMDARPEKKENWINSLWKRI